MTAEFDSFPRGEQAPHRAEQRRGDDRTASPIKGVALDTLVPILELDMTLLALLATAPLAAAQDPFAADVRTTPCLAPDDEQKALHVPASFEIECFAHEPDIYKPMNIAFDARGRLWCTSSTEYPWAVGADRGFRGRDKITIHADRDGDGVAELVSVFADDLNVPIGIYPCVDRAGHDGAIVFSVPNIWRLWDDDGDLRADRREVLYGPMGWERDVHGLQNSFRRGLDGWIYANHGYNNTTTVAGSDGHEIRMESGNTFRFRIDGSRIELFTQGQVNPFGSSFDERGDLYTADCHTLPITLLVRGGCYESFGKPGDGLGFTPQIMKHLHASTALCGLAITTGDLFPREWQDRLFVGNVMTCRVHCDQLLFDGSTPRADERPDFVVSDDPWFRPVDLQFGPDGALYVADFYNRIIGHYEVALDHPGRDRTSGRIWRISFAGEDGATKFSATVPDLRSATADELVSAFRDPNLGIRMRALDELTDRIEPEAAAAAVRRAMTATRRDDARAGAMLVHAIFRLGLAAEFAGPLAKPGLPRGNVLRMLAESHDGIPGIDSSAFLLESLADPDPFVRRAAVDALGQHPSVEHVEPLLAMWARTPASDAILRHSIKIALRNQLRLPDAMARAESIDVDTESARLLQDVCLALHGEEVGRFLIDALAEDAHPDARSITLLEHAAREAGPADLPPLVEWIRSRFGADRALQLRMLETIVAGLDRRDAQPDSSFESWTEELVTAVLSSPGAVAPAWRDVPVAGVGKSRNPWCVQVRPCSDGVDAPMLCSLPRGEDRTGILRSPPFELPAKLAFFVAGHNGETDRAMIPFNKVRVVDAATGVRLAEALPPRKDVAEEVVLELAEFAGRRGVLELVDANPYDGYAWIAAGRFDPPVVAMPERSPADVADEILAACRLAIRFDTDGRIDRLAALARSRLAEPAVRAAAASSLLAGWESPPGSALAALMDDPDAPPELVDPTCEAIVSRDEARLVELALRGVEICPGRQQAPLAIALAATSEGATRLCELVARGAAPASLLVDEIVRDALVASLGDGGAERIAALTEGTPSAEEARARRIAELRSSYARWGGESVAGEDVFGKSCAACHQVAGRGALVGPQLDGIASRGFERLIEDIVDPSRNVDVRFQTTVLLLESGTIVPVLVRRVEDATLVCSDTSGQELYVREDEIAERHTTRLSTMPGNLGETLSDEELRNLLAYLLAASSPAAVRFEGRVVFDGGGPPRASIALDEEMSAVEGATSFLDETWIVDEDGGVRDCVIVLVPVEDGGGTRVQPIQGAAFAKRGCRYEPRVLVVTPGTTVDFRNENSPCFGFRGSSPRTAFDFTLRPAQQRSVLFESPGIVPIECPVRAYMRGSIVVVSSPHFAVSGPGGNFTIDGLAPGEYWLWPWHADMGRKGFAAGEPASGPPFPVTIQPLGTEPLTIRITGPLDDARPGVALPARLPPWDHRSPH